MKTFFKNSKLKELEFLIEDIRKNHLKNWKTEKERKLEEQLDNLVYIIDTKSGKKKGERVKKEDDLRVISIENLLEQQKIITEEEKDDSPILGIKEHLLCNLSKLIEREKLEEICETKAQLVWLEKFGEIKESLNDIKVLKKFLDSVLEVSKENINLKEKLLELETEVDELKEQVKRNENYLREILLIGKSSNHKTTIDFQTNNDNQKKEVLQKTSGENSNSKQCNELSCLKNKKNLDEMVKIIESWQIKAIVKKVENFLKARNEFLVSLEEVIEELRNCHDKLKENINVRQAKRDVVVKGINDIGGSITLDIKIVNPIKLVATVITACNEYYKIDFRAKCSKEFKRCLENDREDMFLFRDTYNSLVYVYKNKELEISSDIVDILELELKKGGAKCFKPFNVRYEKIYSIVNSRKEEYWTIEDMKEKVNSLSADLDNLKGELKGEETLFEEVKNKLKERQFQTQQETPPKKGS